MNLNDDDWVVCFWIVHFALGNWTAIIVRPHNQGPYRLEQRLRMYGVESPRDKKWFAEAACPEDHLDDAIVQMDFTAEIQRLTTQGKTTKLYINGPTSEFVRRAKAEVPGAAAYPPDWPKCPGCGEPALDGKVTCGDVRCGSSTGRS